MAFSGQLSEVDSLLPPRGSWGLSSGRQVWPSQPSHPPSKTPTQALGSEFRKLTVDVDGFSTEAERGHVGAWAGGCGRNPRMVRPCSVAALFPAAASAVAVSFLQPGTRVCRSSDDAVSLMGDRHRDSICAPEVEAGPEGDVSSSHHGARCVQGGQVAEKESQRWGGAQVAQGWAFTGPLSPTVVWSWGPTELT